jgi:hypothetical protein
MRKFRPDIFLSSIEALESRVGNKTPPSSFYADPKFMQIFDALENECRNTDLLLSAAWMQRIRMILNPPMSDKELQEKLHELRHRVVDELFASAGRFIAISTRKKGFEENPFPFGYEVMTAFPEASEDISEAAKCYALERNTACVFHLMRAIEVGIRKLREHFKVNEIKNSNWGTTLANVERAIDDARDKRRITGETLDRYREVLSDLRIIKDAWRNPTMHIERSYDEELALDIFRAVRRFLQDLAGTLKQPMTALPS